MAGSLKSSVTCAMASWWLRLRENRTTLHRIPLRHILPPQPHAWSKAWFIATKRPSWSARLNHAGDWASGYRWWRRHNVVYFYFYWNWRNLISSQILDMSAAIDKRHGNGVGGTCHQTLKSNYQSLSRKTWKVIWRRWQWYRAARSRLNIKSVMRQRNQCQRMRRSTLTETQAEKYTQTVRDNSIPFFNSFVPVQMSSHKKTHTKHIHTYIVRPLFMFFSI